MRLAMSPWHSANLFVRLPNPASCETSLPKTITNLEMNRRTVLLTGANRQVQVDVSSTASLTLPA